MWHGLGRQLPLLSLALAASRGGCLGLDVLGHQLGFQGCTPQIVPLGFGIVCNGILQDCIGSEKGKMGTCWENLEGYHFTGTLVSMFLHGVWGFQGTECSRGRFRNELGA